MHPLSGFSTTLDSGASLANANGFGSAGSRQNNLSESGATIFHSTRSCGPCIPGERNRSTAPQTDLAMEIARGSHFLYPQAERHFYPVIPVDRIAVAQKISAPLVPGKRYRMLDVVCCTSR